MCTGLTPAMAVEDSILDVEVSSLLVEQLVKRTRRNVETANALSQPIGIHPALGAIQSHVKDPGATLSWWEMISPLSL